MNAHDLKSLVSIPQVLGMYGIDVKKRIPCPIHGGEKNNFAVHEDYFKCFSCGASGDIFSLVQSVSQVNFLEAKKIICDYFNISPPSTKKIAKTNHKASLERIALKNEYRRVLKRVRAYQEIRICEALRGVRTLEGDSFLERHLEGLLNRFSQKPDFFIAHDIHAHLNALLLRHKEESTYIFNTINTEGVIIMSYMVLHMNKFKADAIKGIENHNSRSRKSQSNPDIDYSRAKDNYELLENPSANYVEAIQNRIDELLMVKAVRKDAVRMCGLIVSSDAAFFERLSAEETRRFFEESKAFLSDFVGKENVIAATVHMDEKTPHMHFMHVPITKDGRLNANGIYTRESLRKLQSDLPDYLQRKGFGIKRGVEQEAGAAKKHLNTREYKQQQEELKRLNAIETRLTMRNHALSSAIVQMEVQEKELQEQISMYENQAKKAEQALQQDVHLPEASMFNFKSAMEKAKQIIELQRQALVLQKSHEQNAERLQNKNSDMKAKIKELEGTNKLLHDNTQQKLQTMQKNMHTMQASLHALEPFLQQPEIAALHKSFCATQEKAQKREQERQLEVAAQAAGEQAAASVQEQSTCRPALRMR